MSSVAPGPSSLPARAGPARVGQPEMERRQRRDVEPEVPASAARDVGHSQPPPSVVAGQERIADVEVQLALDPGRPAAAAQRALEVEGARHPGVGLDDAPVLLHEEQEPRVARRFPPTHLVRGRGVHREGVHTRRPARGVRATTSVVTRS